MRPVALATSAYALMIGLVALHALAEQAAAQVLTPDAVLRAVLIAGAGAAFGAALLSAAGWLSAPERAAARARAHIAPSFTGLLWFGLLLAALVIEVRLAAVALDAGGAAIAPWAAAAIPALGRVAACGAGGLVLAGAIAWALAAVWAGFMLVRLRLEAAVIRIGAERGGALTVAGAASAWGALALALVLVSTLGLGLDAVPCTAWRAPTSFLEVTVLAAPFATAWALVRAFAAAIALAQSR